jgi:hypothetical protein
MGEPEKKTENEKKEEKKIEPEDLIGEELIRWMTEGTPPNHVPRSDCG